MGDAETGVTTMMTDKGMDTGDVLLMRRTPIGARETAGELTDRLALLGAELLMETIRALEAGTLCRTPQDHAQATYEPKLSKELGNVDFARPAAEIDRLVRGVTPWPGAYTSLGGETVKLFSVRALPGAPSGEPGRVAFADARRGLAVSCGDCDLEILEMQMPGSKRMRAADYLRGHSIETGVCLGKA